MATVAQDENIIADVLAKIDQIRTTTNYEIQATTVSRIFTSPVEMDDRAYPAIYITDSEEDFVPGGQGTDFARFGYIQGKMLLNLICLTKGSDSITTVRQLAWAVLKTLSLDPTRGGNARDTNLTKKLVSQGWSMEHRDVSVAKLTFEITYSYKKTTP